MDERAEVPAGTTVTVTVSDGGLRISGALSWFLPAPGESLIVVPIDPDGYVRVGSRGYRGAGNLYSPARNGVTVVNQLGLESYLAGVVSAEMGRGDSRRTRRSWPRQ